MTTLSAVKQFMESHHRASVLEVATALGTTPDVVRNMLEMWAKKNCVRRLASICSSCGKNAIGACTCAIGADISDIYEWVDTHLPNPDAS